LSVREQKRVSLQTVQRLSVYRKVLEELDHDGTEYVHSHELAALVGVTPAQLRRDLASFGTFGNIARGYNVYEMSRTISRILGTNEIQNVALFGVGDLGRALLSYRGFEERGFQWPSPSTWTARRWAACSPAGDATTSTSSKRPCANTTRTGGPGHAT